MIIWKTVPVAITHKILNVKKAGGKASLSFVRDFGEVPVVRFNEVTGKFEEVVNNRGNAYAARNRLKYRKN